MRYEFMNKGANSMIKRPYANGYSWFIFLLVVLFFLGFYFMASRITYIPNSMQIETGGITHSVMMEFPKQK